MTSYENWRSISHWDLWLTMSISDWYWSFHFDKNYPRVHGCHLCFQDRFLEILSELVLACVLIWVGDVLVYVWALDDFLECLDKEL